MLVENGYIVRVRLILESVFFFSRGAFYIFKLLSTAACYPATENYRIDWTASCSHTIICKTISQDDHFPLGIFFALPFPFVALDLD